MSQVLGTRSTRWGCLLQRWRTSVCRPVKWVFDRWHKELANAKVGDTVTHKDRPAEEPLEGFTEIKPMAYSGIYPIDSSDFEPLRKALEKLQLNDAAFFEAENSMLGIWFSM